MVILSYLQRRKLPSLKRRTVKASRVNYMLLKFPFTQAYTMASKQKKVSFSPMALWHCRFGLPCQVQKELDSFFKPCCTKALEWGTVPVLQNHSHYLHWTERGLGRTDKTYLNMRRDGPTNVGWLFVLSFGDSFQINKERRGKGWRIGYCCTCCQMALNLYWTT